ncbi:MAG: DUF370 domain-containing protein [Oscillospiraceae bacterium]|jgi:hypothetical protein|nr:DUF370 domain-containing protein [Oscillospiraceae bacterium]
MYLHLGKNAVSAYADVVAVCDLDSASHSHLTRTFLSAAEKNGQVINVCEDLPKAFVVCADKRGGQTLYLSQLAAATLLKRAGTQSFE